ncbi:MAG: hypothetical protein R3F62_08585 [Planctomycetota bacterium]
MDGLAGMVSVPISVFLAWFYGARLQEAPGPSGAESINNVTLIVVLIAMGDRGLLLFGGAGRVLQALSRRERRVPRSPSEQVAAEPAPARSRPPAA